MLNADRVLQEFVGRDRYNRGALVDPKRFEMVLTNLVRLIYEAAGAIPYDTSSSVPLHHKGWFGVGQFGEITVPEFNHMSTSLGLQFMAAVTLDRTDA